MILSYLKQCLVVSLITITPLNKNIKGASTGVDHTYERTLKEVVIKDKHSSKFRRGEFLGFQLQKPLNTRIHETLEKALLSYQGPKVMITSLRRFGTVSKHCCGKAVDFEWSHELIEYLVSEEGTAWRNTNGIKTFYIEDRPGSKLLKPYKNNVSYQQYVFENPAASGPHIHLNL